MVFEPDDWRWRMAFEMRGHSRSDSVRRYAQWVDVGDDVAGCHAAPAVAEQGGD